MKTLIILFLFVCTAGMYCSENKFDTVYSSENLKIIKISDDVYVHISYFNVKDWGRIPSNGMIVVNKSQAALFDTPMDLETTKLLVETVKNVLKSDIVLFVPNHWHDDCIGGLEYLNQLNIESYSNIMTYDISKSKSKPLTTHTFKDSITLHLNDVEIICQYFGEAHASDNIICAIPSKKIIFAGCMLKDMNAKTLGNLSDANIKEWSKTLRKLKSFGANYGIFVPGHGDFGGKELIDHTLKLVKKGR